MRIAILVSHFPQNSETFILNRITGLIDQGHDVDIYAYAPGEPGAVHGDVARYGLMKRIKYFAIPDRYPRRIIRAFAIFLKYFPRRPLLLLRSINVLRYGREALSLRLLCGCVSFVGSEKYDVAHSHHGPNGLKDTWLKEIGALTGAHVTSFHGADASRHPRIYGRGVYRRLFERGDLFLPVSAGMKDKLVALGCPDSKIRVHYSGIDCKKFAYRGPRRFLSEKVFLVMIGRLVEKKGHRYAIEALKIASKSLPRLALRIVGEGPLRSELARFAADCGLGDRVYFEGSRPQEEIIRILRESDILMAPSVTAADGNCEGIPNAIKEAMAVGLPVVSTRHGEICEIIEDGTTGLLARERDAAGLSSCIHRLVGSPDLCESMCRKAREKVEQDFDIERLNQRLVEIYKELSNA